MTKEYEQRKGEKPPSSVWKVVEIIVKVCVIVVAMLFLLMVALPAGGWTRVFLR